MAAQGFDREIVEKDVDTILSKCVRIKGRFQSVFKLSYKHVTVNGQVPILFP